MTDFFVRLKQRKLVQWALAYLAAAWVCLQVLDLASGSYHWPETVMHIAFGVLAVGLVVVLVLAWYHGERGVQRVSGVELLIIALVLAVGGGVLWNLARAPGTKIGVARVAVPGEPQPAVSGTSTLAPGKSLTAPLPIPTNSIAVLPLENESGDQTQQYFSDGLSEDLITALSQLAGLKVISRNSSFKFRDSEDSSARIGQLLGVAHLLEGSVQHSGKEVRITATLVNAADGSIVWSRRYDRPYTDLFELQDEIVNAVATALKAKLLAPAGMVAQTDRPPSGNLAAYNDFLQGQFHAHRFTEDSLRESNRFYEQAIKADPRYALAWTGLANNWASLAGNMYGGARARQAWDKARQAIGTALSLDPDLAQAHAVNSFILSSAGHDWTGALAAAQRAHELVPNKYFHEVATIQAALGNVQQAVELIERGLPSDPLCAGCYSELAVTLPALGRLDEGIGAARKSLELRPGNYFLQMELTYLLVQRGDATAAMSEANKLPSGLWRDMALAFALQVGSDRAAADAALQRVIDTQAGNGAYQIAEMYALRQDPDRMFEWLDRADRNRDPGVTELLYDPPVLRYRADPRFAAFRAKVGLPAATSTGTRP